MDLPSFIHDTCPKCVFLGAHTHNGLPVDLYACKQSESGDYPTLIARFGDEPSDYAAGITANVIFDSTNVLHEAFRRAYSKNLLTISWGSDSTDDDEPSISVSLKEIIKRAANPELAGVNRYAINEGANPSIMKELSKEQALTFMSEEEFESRKS